MRKILSIVLLSCFLILNASAKEKSSNSKTDSKSEPTKQGKKFFDPTKVKYCNLGKEFTVEAQGDAGEEICVWYGEKPEADSVWKNGKDFSKALNYAENKANKIADNALARFKDRYKFPLKSKKLSTRKRFTCSDASFEKQGLKFEIIETEDRNDPNKQHDPVAVFNSTSVVVTDEGHVGFHQAKKNHKKWIPDVGIPFVYYLNFTITDVPVDMSCNDIDSSLEQYLKTEAAK